MKKGKSMQRRHDFLKGTGIRLTLLIKKITTVFKDLNNEIHNKTSIIPLDSLDYVQRSIEVCVWGGRSICVPFGFFI